MRCYLAARYSRHPEVEQVANALRDLGHEVVSRWHSPAWQAEVDPTGTERNLAEGWERKSALADTEDLRRAECLILFTEPEPGPARGGKHVEFGIAVGFKMLGCPMRLVVVGPRQENIFQHLPEVEQYISTEHLLAALKAEKRRGTR